MADYLGKFEEMPLRELEENAYALQIKYDPPLKEEDRDYILREIQWIINNRDKINEEEIMQNRREWRTKRGKMCNQEVSVITGENLLLYSDHQLIFVPFKNANSKTDYYCFTRNEALYILEDEKNPYTNIKFSEKQLDYIRKKLKLEYPNIPISGIISEIDERIYDNVLHYTPKEYKALAEELSKLVKKYSSDINSAFIYDFATNLSSDEYNLFLRHRGLEQKIGYNVYRDLAAKQTLRHILNKYKLLKGTNKYKSRMFIVEIANAIDEFLYMTKNNLNYTELLEEKGKAIRGEVKELYWKPNFMIETYYDNGNIKSRHYVNKQNKIEGLYSHYRVNGSIIEEKYYLDGKLNGLSIEYNEEGNLEFEGNYKDGKLNGIAIKYNDGVLFSKLNFVNGIKQGYYKRYYPDGSINISAHYSKDKINGTVHVYDVNGKLVSAKKYKDDFEV